MKNIYSILFVISLGFLSSCEGDLYGGLKLQGRSGDQNLTINAAYLSSNALSNIQVYAFNGAGSSLFNHRVHTMTQTDNILSMVVPADTWDFVLLSAESGDLGQVHVPGVGSSRAASLMWTCPDNGVELLSAPEIITARTGAITIAPSAHENTEAWLTRNVAMVTVKVDDVAGVKAGGNHTISLLDVPCSLTWDGGLYPNKTNPDVSPLPMVATAVFHDHATEDIQYSDAVTFLVPAHQGSDFLSDEPGFPKDTSTHKLWIAVDLELEVGGRLQKSAELPLVPKANRRLEVGLRVGSNLNVTASIHDWQDHRFDADVANTTLVVNKTNAGLSWRDTVYVQTNALSGYTVTSGAPWLTATKDGNRIILEADTESYFTAGGTSRTCNVTVTANNINKRISVTQRPDVGTISHSISDPPHSFWVSPTLGNAERTVTVTSTGPWELVRPATETVTPSVSGGSAGTNMPVRFTRKEHVGVIQREEYANYYGVTEYKLKNKQTLEVIDLTANNLYLDIDPLDVPNAIGENIKENEDVAFCFGGSFSAISMPNWMTSITVSPSGTITLIANGEPTGEKREGTATFRHDVDPTYTVQVRIIQDFLITIPPFDYFVIKYNWGAGTSSTNSDIDIKVQFENNNMPYDGQPFNGGSNTNNKWVGFNVSQQLYKTMKLLEWGGDAQAGQGETAFFNAPLIDSDDASPRYVTLACYAYWHTNSLQSLSGTPVRTTIYAYKGGTMTKVAPNFVNTGGELLYSNTKQQKVTIRGASSILNPEKLVEVVYDRIKHSAEIHFTGTELNTPVIPQPASAPAVIAPMSLEDSAEAELHAKEKEMQSQQTKQ